MRTKRAKRTMAQIRATARARKMLRDPYYQELRGPHFKLGAKEAMRTVRNFDALIIGIEKTVDRQLCQIAEWQLKKARGEF